MAENPYTDKAARTSIKEQVAAEEEPPESWWYIIPANLLEWLLALTLLAFLYMSTVILSEADKDQADYMNFREIALHPLFGRLQRDTLIAEEYDHMLDENPELNELLLTSGQQRSGRIRRYQSDELTLTAAYKRFFSKSLPFILVDGATQWPAAKYWFDANGHVGESFRDQVRGCVQLKEEARRRERRKHLDIKSKVKHQLSLLSRGEEDDLVDEWLGQTQLDTLEFEGVVDKLTVPESSLLFAEIQQPKHLGAVAQLEKV